ncbi:N-acetylmuramoyl-L-alanine amidase, partial [Corallococcus exercitus]|nr:N-acetylmuramoyl-L-alanine amidase [Corallococcus exercitus]
MKGDIRKLKWIAMGLAGVAILGLLAIVVMPREAPQSP